MILTVSNLIKVLDDYGICNGRIRKPPTTGGIPTTDNRPPTTNRFYTDPPTHRPPTTDLQTGLQPNHQLPTRDPPTH